ncbi:MAG: rhomboid family intramembrane serine protease [Elusimicrobiales bacterium]|nr:rhomboid family intramembrane serine protease [Elusimicrobiales bacterium]
MRVLLDEFHSLPRATRLFLAALLGGWLLSLLFGYRFELLFGLVPARVTGNYWIWQTATYMFLHDGFWHLFLNSLLLWMLGGMMENVWGSRRFVRYCFITGVGAALFHIAAGPQSGIPVVGASGAVFGLIAAFALTFPESTVYFYFVFPMKAKYMAVIIGAIELAASFNPHRGAIANLAHLGGMITGYLYLRWYPVMLEKLSGAMPDRREPAPKPAPRPASRMDALLDKISKRGVNSLNESEKEEMERYSKWLKK